MFPFWEIALEPLIAAVDPKRVLEIGSLRGETTELLLAHLRADVELHVVDPAPDFEPSEHEANFRGRYVFHRDLSHQVLPGLPAVDVALIDGDHNWYTVHGELELLAAAARRDGAPLPLVMLHDVAWPYGRRDLYYAPETIPAEFRHPYRQAGMRPGRRSLLDSGGLNATMNNAENEGGPRNGVMTAIEDFAAAYEHPVRVLVLPIYFGLAIVASEQRLALQPALAAAFEELEKPETGVRLQELAEKLRIQAMVFQHNVLNKRDRELDAATKRYLQVVRGALLNEHYLDHETRIAALTRAIGTGRPVDIAALRDPLRNDQQQHRALERQRLGTAGPEASAADSFLPYTAMGRTRMEHLERVLDSVREERIPGDLAECGTGRGGGAIFLRAYIDAYELDDRTVWVADSFRASDPPDRKPTLPKNGVAGFRADLNLVRDGFHRFGLLDERVRFLQGPMDATLADAPIEQLALLRVGRRLAGDIGAVLDRLYDKVAPGGFVIVDDFGERSCRKAVKAFWTRRGIKPTHERIDGSAMVWRKPAHTAGPTKGTTTVATHHTAGPPLAPALPVDAIDLTVVVVMFNMRREAERTLHSLSKAYQSGIDGLEYEVLVVENGSDPEQKLGPAFVERYGSEFRYLDMGDDAPPSPVSALNRGIREGRGRSFALMIDGAHVLTPGVLQFGVTGLGSYASAVVATQQWYVGPGQQGDAIEAGYDERAEDSLFEAIAWPLAGYRLFEIGHFIGDRDWLDGMWESNCLFTPRSLLEQAGCFDESFVMPSGGYANLDLYERLTTSPDVTVVTILGEASFHQVHGGTTTNVPPEERRRRVFGYGEHYAEVRGRRFHGPAKPLHFVGRIASPAARRTRARRLSAEMFEATALSQEDGRPTAPMPVPQDLGAAFTDAVWHSLPWDRTTWLGRRIDTAPTDLLAYQEIITSVQPAWVVEIGTGDGGRSLFLASMCELIEHGKVLSVDATLAGDVPQHPRLQYVEGVPHDPATVRAVFDVVGPSRPVVVVLGACSDQFKTAAQFEAYQSLVTVGSYTVIADTVVNGHPVWPGFGPGPAEAVKQVLGEHGEFAQDPLMEKYSLTFNPGGFLKRIR
jgi:cephalosporin hydroxylase